MFLVMSVWGWDQLGFESNLPFSVTRGKEPPVPGSVGFVVAFETREAAEEFAEGKADVVEVAAGRKLPEAR